MHILMHMRMVNKMIKVESFQIGNSVTEKDKFIEKLLIQLNSVIADSVKFSIINNDITNEEIVDAVKSAVIALLYNIIDTTLKHFIPDDQVRDYIDHCRSIIELYFKRLEFGEDLLNH